MPYIYHQVERKVHFPEIREAICDNCGGNIPIREGHDRLLDGGLHIQFEGGYGEYFDHRMNKAIICRACAIHLFKAMPGLDRFVASYE